LRDETAFIKNAPRRKDQSCHHNGSGLSQRLNPYSFADKEASYT